MLLPVFAQGVGQYSPRFQRETELREELRLAGSIPMLRIQQVAANLLLFDDRRIGIGQLHSFTSSLPSQAQRYFRTRSSLSLVQPPPNMCLAMTRPATYSCPSSSPPSCPIR